MTTVRQIEKQWNSEAFSRLTLQMLAGRPEASSRLASELVGPIPAAAMALLRLDELAQAHVPFYSKLLRYILTAQGSDGGWNDPLTTALCLRALFAGRGQGAAIDRALQYLAQMQKSEGIWPKVPIRRMSADAFVSAFILLQLGTDLRFRAAVRLESAIEWFHENQSVLDFDTQQLWNWAKRRLPLVRAQHHAQGVLSWS